MLRSLVAFGGIVVLSVSACQGQTGATAGNESAQHAAVSETLKAGDWPNWRGPQTDLISRETGWTSDLGTDGPKQLWKAELGTGFSSVSVADGRLYSMGHRDGQDTVYCLDAATGEQRWTHSYPCKLVDNLHEGGPASTPTVDGDAVYTVSKEGHVFCLDAVTGKVRWTVELQPTLDVPMPEWGFSGSAVVIGDTIVLDAGCVVALDKATGNVVWKTEKYKAGYGSATAFLRNDELLLAVLNNEALLMLRASDGKELAKTPWDSSFNTVSISPIVSGDTIFVSSGYNKGCALYELGPGESDAGLKLTERYKNKKMANHMANCVLIDGHLYGFSGNSHNARNVLLVCMEYATGKVVWDQRGLGCGTLMASDGKLIILSDDGRLVFAPAEAAAFKPGAEYQVLEGKFWSVPVLSHGRIYLRNAEGTLVALDVSGQAKT